MSKRDIRREEIGETIEDHLQHMVRENANFFENAKIELENDGHITVTYHPELSRPTIYDIKVSKRR